MQSKTAEFRAAVCAGNLGAADRLLSDLRQEVELRWSAATAAERPGIAAQILDLLAWARQILLARRAHTQRRLTQVVRQGAYAWPAAGATRVDFEG